LPVHFKKNVRLAAQDVRLDRLLDEIHGARFITPETTLTSTARCHEYNGDMTRSLIASHEFCKLKSVKSGPLDVNQRQRNIMLQQQFKRVITGFRFQQL
jgi:hypothetical protein